MSTHVPHLVLPVTPERDHIRGPVTAPITLLEYGDYECPYCGAAHPIVHEVRRLFEHQDALSDEALIAHADALGLDVERFARELADGAHAPKVRHDFVSGVRSGVKGTPCFYINGVRRDGQYDLAALLGAVEAVLRAA